MVMRAYASLDAQAKEKETAEKAVTGHARLAALAPAFADFEAPLPREREVTVGRRDPANNVHPDVDLTAIDPQISTSRRHARIWRRASAFYIQDEETTNGTRVNEQRISTERPIEIRHGDEITFGAVRMRFIVE